MRELEFRLTIAMNSIPRLIIEKIHESMNTDDESTVNLLLSIRNIDSFDLENFISVLQRRHYEEYKKRYSPILSNKIHFDYQEHFIRVKRREKNLFLLYDKPGIVWHLIELRYNQTYGDDEDEEDSTDHERYEFEIVQIFSTKPKELGNLVVSAKMSERASGFWLNLRTFPIDREFYPLRFI